MVKPDPVIRSPDAAPNDGKRHQCCRRSGSDSRHRRLGYSRRFHFWCTDREDAEHTYEGLIRSFEWWGGVTADVLVDNQKCAVLEHRADGPRFNPRFLDLGGHYGFTPRACKPARARTKGKDERMVGYIKHHFFVRYRAFDSWPHLNQFAEQWLREEADQRQHGTVHEVAERFAREQPQLQRLLATRYDTSYWELRAGRRVSIRISLDSDLRVYDTDQVVAVHPEAGAKAPRDGSLNATWRRTWSAARHRFGRR